MSDAIVFEPEVVEALKSQEIERYGGHGLATASELSVEQVMEQVNKIQHVMKKAMRNDEHYGVIPGTGSKPTLLKPGAEKLCLTFRLGPKYELIQSWDGDHLTVTATCSLIHIPTGNFVAAGEGLCSTRESKYRYRNASRKCPQCGTEAIIKGKKDFGGGWLCFKKKDGCGAKFNDNDPAIVNQEQGRVENPDLADSYNTVLKMACKRALIAAVLNGTAASDIFTQDLEEKVPASNPDDDWTAHERSDSGQGESGGGAPPSEPSGSTEKPPSLSLESASDGATSDPAPPASDSLSIIEQATEAGLVQVSKVLATLARIIAGNESYSFPDKGLNPDTLPEVDQRALDEAVDHLELREKVG